MKMLLKVGVILVVAGLFFLTGAFLASRGIGPFVFKKPSVVEQIKPKAIVAKVVTKKVATSQARVENNKAPVPVTEYAVAPVSIPAPPTASIQESWKIDLVPVASAAEPTKKIPLLAKERGIPGHDGRTNWPHPCHYGMKGDGKMVGGFCSE
jgi:hypothetical protein